MWSKDLEMSAKKSNDLYFKRQGALTLSQKPLLSQDLPNTAINFKFKYPNTHM